MYPCVYVVCYNLTDLTNDCLLKESWACIIANHIDDSVIFEVKEQSVIFFTNQMNDLSNLLNIKSILNA